jgi:hypothetical protein
MNVGKVTPVVRLSFTFQIQDVLQVSAYSMASCKMSEFSMICSSNDNVFDIAYVISPGFVLPKH